MAATITEVAQKAGVCETTVSLAFRPGSRISAKTRERVLAAARTLNYVPNQAARGLRLGQSHTIGFLVTDLTDPFYGLMMAAAQQVLREHGYQLFVADSQWDPQREQKVLEQMQCARVAGILACMSESSPDNIDFLRESKIPYVLLDSVPEDCPDPYVANDLFRSGELAAEHLRSVGCQHLAMLSGPYELRNFSAFRNLEAGFRAGAGGRSKVAAALPAALSIAGGRDAFASLQQMAPKVDGVFCAHDLSALGVMDAADRMGIAVGKDLAVMGIADLEICSALRISLTSIRQPHAKLASLATTKLIERIRGIDISETQIHIEPTLSIRKSTQTHLAR